MLDDDKIGNDIVEEGTTPPKKHISKTGAIIIVVILSLLVGLIVFLISNSILNPKEKKPDKNEKTELSLDDTNVEILYSYVTYGEENERYTIYLENDNVEFASFTNKEKYDYALMFATADDFKETGEKDDNDNKIYQIPASKVKSYMIRYFGPNVSYNKNNEIKYHFNFTINGNNYGIMNYNGTMDAYNTIFIDNKMEHDNSKIKKYYSKLTSAYSYGDGKIELNEKVIYTDYKLDGDKYTVSIYKDHNHNNLIDTIELSSTSNKSIDIDDYITKASTITYTFETYNNTYYFLNSRITY